eukprot:TRINITY_DN46674_c0_g1_i1.p1 TRINITY_DN46674_c0_g1~~TRINITY_DN46674_c0_g1_i1.p1  ORF type:complete len:176 (+),score=35.91 TRINITY_DN46674_c0_g1_i1:112-639(+)
MSLTSSAADENEVFARGSCASADTTASTVELNNGEEAPLKTLKEEPKLPAGEVESQPKEDVVPDAADVSEATSQDKVFGADAGVGEPPWDDGYCAVPMPEPAFLFPGHATSPLGHVMPMVWMAIGLEFNPYSHYYASANALEPMQVHKTYCGINEPKRRLPKGTPVKKMLPGWAL